MRTFWSTHTPTRLSHFRNALREPTPCNPRPAGSHHTPNAHLDWSKTITWMQRSRFCLCPGGDTPYSKRFFLALAAGCIPVVFSFGAYEGAPGRRYNWWAEGGASNDDALPFSSTIDYSRLVVAVNSSDVVGFIERLRQVASRNSRPPATQPPRRAADPRRSLQVPHALVEEKQRQIERARHHLLYDVTGAREDAFSAALRELVRRYVVQSPLFAGMRGFRAPARRAPR